MWIYKVTYYTWKFEKEAIRGFKNWPIVVKTWRDNRKTMLVAIFFRRIPRGTTCIVWSRRPETGECGGNPWAPFARHASIWLHSHERYSRRRCVATPSTQRFWFALIFRSNRRTWRESRHSNAAVCCHIFDKMDVLIDMLKQTLNYDNNRWYRVIFNWIEWLKYVYSNHLYRK